MEDIIVEVVDDEGMPVPPGTQGRILITNLHNHVMPLIRYENGDIGSIRPIKCSCGRELPLLDLEVGRTGDFIYTPSGKRVAGIAVGLSKFAALGVVQTQVVQDRIDHVVVRIIAPRVCQEEEREAVAGAIRGILGGSLGSDMSIDVDFVEHIDATPAGKHLHVLSKIDPNSWLKRHAEENNP
jgi:phenylacetate-CoA ligase